jgi:hypothetical protein
MTARASTSLAATLAGSSIVAAVVAFLRYRATGISGATFDRSPSGGTQSIITYENAGPWFSHYMTWRGVAIGLAAASVAVVLVARRG